MRYVFEKFNVSEEFLEKDNIVDYWHFDSDNMILTELKTHEKKLRDAYIDCTTLCNDMCPSGFLKTSSTTNLTSSILSNLKDEELIKINRKNSITKPRKRIHKNESLYNS